MLYTKAFLSQYLEEIINENDIYIHCDWTGGSYSGLSSR